VQLEVLPQFTETRFAAEPTAMVFVPLNVTVYIIHPSMSRKKDGDMDGKIN
jgi:hypothetical protein